jgi:hypothetical protein
MKVIPIVLKRPAIPLMPIETIAIDSPNILEGIHTQLGCTQSDDWSQAFMSIVNDSILSAAVSLHLDPYIRERTREMGIGNF